MHNHVHWRAFAGMQRCTPEKCAKRKNRAGISLSNLLILLSFLDFFVGGVTITIINFGRKSQWAAALRRLAAFPSRVLRLGGLGRDGPCSAELSSALHAPLRTVPLNKPHRNSPFLCRFPNGDVLHRLSPQPDGFPFFPDHYIRFCALFSSGNLHQFSVPRKPPPRRARSCALSRSSLPRPGRAQKKQPSCRTAAFFVVAEAGFEPTTFGL